MKYFKYLFLLAILTSCAKPAENFIKIPSDFSVYIQEEIQPTGNKEIYLVLSSMNAQYCQDDSLIYKVSSGFHSLSIEVLDSYKANDCFQRVAFLKARIPLPVFTDSLEIEMNLGSASTVHCHVYNFPNYYNIEVYNGKGLIANPDTTYKIPVNLVWGYAYPKSAGEDGIVLLNNFKNDLEHDCYIILLDKGYYSYFSILDKNVLLLNENPGIVGNKLSFYYHHYETEDELVQFFNKLASKYVNLVGYKINTGSGKEFISN